MVPHEVGGMTMAENPTQGLCKHVRGIHDSGEVDQDDILHKSPMLKCKISDFDMTRAISGSTVIDDLDRGIVVFADGSGPSLSVPQFMKNESQIFGDCCGSISSNEFGFCRALAQMDCVRERLATTPPAKSSMSHCRTTLTLMQFISM